MKAMQLVIASGNAKKRAELERALGHLGVVVVSPAEVGGLQHLAAGLRVHHQGALQPRVVRDATDEQSVIRIAVRIARTPAKRLH